MTILIILYNFLISIFGFGGGTVFLVYIYDYYVLNDLLSIADYNYFTSIAYILPGPLSIKLLALADYQIAGFWGFIIGITVLIIPTIFFIHLSHTLLNKRLFYEYLNKLGYYISPVIAGMILYFTFKFFHDSLGQNLHLFIFICLIVFDLILFYLLKFKNTALLIFLNLLLVILLLKIS